MSDKFPYVSLDKMRVGHLACVHAKGVREWVRVEKIDEDGDITGVTSDGNKVGFRVEHVGYVRQCLEVEDYRRAIRAQTACNGIALTMSMAEVLKCILSEMLFEGRSYDDALKHPIYRLMLHQISYLACNVSPVSLADYSAAYNACETFIKSSDQKTT